MSLFSYNICLNFATNTILARLLCYPNTQFTKLVGADSLEWLLILNFLLKISPLLLFTLFRMTKLANQFLYSNQIFCFISSFINQIMFSIFLLVMRSNCALNKMRKNILILKVKQIRYLFSQESHPKIL